MKTNVMRVFGVTLASPVIVTLFLVWLIQNISETIEKAIVPAIIISTISLPLAVLLYFTLR